MVTDREGIVVSLGGDLSRYGLEELSVGERAPGEGLLPGRSAPARFRPRRFIARGDGGGRIVAQGTPETVAQAPGSHTGSYLRQVLTPDQSTLFRKSIALIRDSNSS